jgi:hypothetical protein
MTSKLKNTAPLLMGISLLVGGTGLLTYSRVAADGAKPAELSVETFHQIQKQIKPQPGESRWLEIPWEIDLHAARKKAAAEGRPMLVMSGGGATAIGTC